MNKTFKLMVTGDFACYTRPEFKVERVTYDVPTPGALEGMLKCVYWKPAIRYVIDKIIVFRDINYFSIRTNEVKNRVSYKAINDLMEGKPVDPCIYAAENRSQRCSLLLRDVMYGIEFHFELTGLQDDRSVNSEKKHYNIIKRRLEKGQCFCVPSLGRRKYPVKSMYLVDEFDNSLISENILKMGDVDLGYMCYKVVFDDHGIPMNNDWDDPIFSDKAHTVYYRPHMINGIIDVEKYREGIKC